MRKAIGSLAGLLSTLVAVPPAASQEIQTTLIPVQAFVPIDDLQQFSAQGGQIGYVGPRLASPITMWAPLSVPVGVAVEEICVHVIDGSAAAQVAVDLYVALTFTGGSIPTPTVLATKSSGIAANPGGAKICLEPAIGGFAFPWLVRTVEPEGTGPTLQYFLRAVVDPGLGLGPAVVKWTRGVSPAPDTATFADVPTNDDYFQQIEAIAASGAMASCDGGPNFCPDAPVSRKQLALVLARALGVYWPN